MAPVPAVTLDCLFSFPDTTRALEVRFAAAKKRPASAQDYHGELSGAACASASAEEEVNGILRGPWYEAEPWAELFQHQGDAFGFLSGKAADLVVNSASKSSKKQQVSFKLHCRSLDF